MSPAISSAAIVAALLYLSPRATVGAPAPAEECAPGAGGALARARALAPPRAAGTGAAEFEHAAFWEAHGPLLRAAWAAWDAAEFAEEAGGDVLGDPLAAALTAARRDPGPATEAAVAALWTEHVRGVHAARLLSREGVARLRRVLDAAHASGIPARRPNGMNRRGVIVDSAVDGAVATTPLVAAVERLSPPRAAARTPRCPGTSGLVQFGR